MGSQRSTSSYHNAQDRENTHIHIIVVQDRRCWFLDKWGQPSLCSGTITSSKSGNDVCSLRCQRDAVGDDVKSVSRRTVDDLLGGAIADEARDAGNGRTRNVAPMHMMHACMYRGIQHGKVYRLAASFAGKLVTTSS